MINLHCSEHEGLFQRIKSYVSSVERGEEDALWGENVFVFFCKLDVNGSSPVQQIGEFRDSHAQ